MSSPASFDPSRPVTFSVVATEISRSSIAVKKSVCQCALANIPDAQVCTDGFFQSPRTRSEYCGHKLPNHEDCGHDRKCHGVSHE